MSLEPAPCGYLGHQDNRIRAKVVDDDELSHFKAIGALLADPCHSQVRRHIVGLIALPFTLPDRRHIIFMPNTGQSLNEVEGQKFCSPDDIPRLVLQLCDAVSFLHSNSIYHLDIKPENVMMESVETRAGVGGSGRAKVSAHDLRALNVSD